MRAHLPPPPSVLRAPATAEAKPSRGRSNVSVHAACVYIACRQVGLGRTVREICSAAEGTNIKEINKARAAAAAASLPGKPRSMLRTSGPTSGSRSSSHGH